jgi:2-hydroxychromene-2-carboxylate isomerase
MAPLQFWFDFASTYSYVAAMRIEELAAARGVPLDWRPFLLGPIFQRQGWNDSPFNINPFRGRYMWRDIERLCRKYRLPFRKPSLFPRNSLLAARVALVVSDRDWLPAFVRAVYRANFAEDRDIAAPGVIGEVLGTFGENDGRLLAAAQTPENKERLRRRTEEAWEAGLFGAPTFVVGGELFWGHDRLDDAFDWTA